MKNVKMNLLVISVLLLSSCSQVDLIKNSMPETPNMIREIELTPTVIEENSKPVETMPAQTPFASTDYPSAVIAAIANLSARLGIPEKEITVVDVINVEWPDTCLGVTKPGIMCAQMITPGYTIILGVDQKKYEYHTDMDGKSMKIVK